MAGGRDLRRRDHPQAHHGCGAEQGAGDALELEERELEPGEEEPGDREDD